MNELDIFEAHDGHRERLRRRIMDSGLDALAPHEVVEFLLCYAIPRQDVNDLAHQLLEKFESLRGILDASYEQLMEIEGLGDYAARWLCLIGENARTFSRIMEHDTAHLRNYADAFRYALKLKDSYRPCCAVQLCLDAGSRLVFHRSFCESPRWGEPEAFRLALDDAICSEARDIIILIYTHQHTPVPSYYDITHAQSYANLMHTANCSLLDVVLVGRKNLCSLRRLGHIPDRNNSPLKRTLREDYMRGMPDADAICGDDYADEA